MHFLSTQMFCHPGNMSGYVSMANDVHKSKMDANIATTNMECVKCTIPSSLYFVLSDIPIMVPIYYALTQFDWKILPLPSFKFASTSQAVNRESVGTNKERDEQQLTRKRCLTELYRMQITERISSVSLRCTHCAFE